MMRIRSAMTAKSMRKVGRIGAYSFLYACEIDAKSWVD